MLFGLSFSPHHHLVVVVAAEKKETDKIHETFFSLFEPIRGESLFSSFLFSPGLSGSSSKVEQRGQLNQRQQQQQLGLKKKALAALARSIKTKYALPDPEIVKNEAGISCLPSLKFIASSSHFWHP